MTQHVGKFVLALTATFGLCAAPFAQAVEHGNVQFDVSPDGEHIVFVAADGNLYLLHLTSLRVRQLTKAKDKQFTPAFSPDGKSIAYAGVTKEDEGSYIFVRSLDGEHVRQLTGTREVSDLTPSYSHDGSKLVFTRAHRYRPYSMGGWTWDNYDVYTMNLDGTELRRITRQNYYSAGSPKFLRDGKSVIYSAFVGPAGKRVTATAFQVDASGHQLPKPLSKDQPAEEGEFFAWASRANISADGSRIVFFSDRVKAYQYDLFVMNSDGTSPKPLHVTKISRYNDNAVFMPDGKSILFLAGTESWAGNGPLFDLWQVNVDGTNLRQIADSGLFTSPAHWKPRR